MSTKEEKLMEEIRGIIRRGNNVEIRGTKEGELKVFEVKKHIIPI